MIRKIEVSSKTIIFTFLLVVTVWFLYLIRDIILGFFVALLLMTIINPTVAKLMKIKIPRTLAVVLIYLSLLSLTGVAIALIIPPLIDETTGFINSLPKTLVSFGIFGNLLDQIIKQLISQIITLPSQIAKVTFSIFSNIIGVITVLIFAFYLLVDRNNFEKQFGTFFGEKNQEKAIRLINLLEQELGGWARGELILMFVLGILSFTGLKILGVPYALPLSILAGLMEIVPNFGPVISAAPTIIIGFGVSPIIGLSTIALSFLIHQLENYLLVPRVMQGSTGVNPIVTLLALAVGFRLAGVVGAIISVPVVITIRVFTREYLTKKGQSLQTD